MVWSGTNRRKQILRRFSEKMGNKARWSIAPLNCLAIPPCSPGEDTPDGTHSVAYYIMDRNTGRRLLVAPDVAECNEALAGAMREADAVLFDGTFWSEDELLRIKANGRTAAEMGHITIRDFSLALLGPLPATHKIYIHVNNTNPVLCPGSPERIAVDAAGILVGHDGLEFDL